MRAITDFLKKRIFYIIGVLTALFLMFGQRTEWAQYGGDTTLYLDFQHHSGVKPIYPLLIQGMRYCFGEQRYLFFVVLVQIILSLLAIMTLTVFISKSFDLSWWMTILIWGCLLIPYVLLLPEDAISHTLMTESLSYPLTYLFVYLNLKGLFEEKYGWLIGGILLAAICSLTRGQLLIYFPVCLVVCVYYFIKYRCGLIKLFILILSLLIMYKGQGYLGDLYERTCFDTQTTNQMTQAFVQKLLYCADEEDATLFTDDATREIFSAVYDRMISQESNYKNIPYSIYSWKKVVPAIGNDSYILGEVIEEYCSANGKWTQDEKANEQITMLYSEEISEILMKQHWDRALLVSLGLMPAGFVSTMLFHKEAIYGLVHVATAVLYLFLLVGSVIMCRNGKTKVAEYIWIVLLISVVNVVASNIIHFGLQRYLAYTVGLNWVGIVVLICCLLTRIFGNKESLNEGINNNSGI